MFLDDYRICSKLTKDKFNVNVSYNYWKNILFEYAMKLFSWSGLPDSIPQKEIEMRLFLYGKCGINKNNKGDFIATIINFDGVTDYWDIFTHYTWATPSGQGICIIDKNGVVIDNNSLRNGLYKKIHHYATLLAHTDVTLVNSLVNGRSTMAITAINEKMAESAREYRRRVYNGDVDCLVDKGFSSLDFKDMATDNVMSVKELFDLRQSILSAYLEDIGIRKKTEKRERLVTDEVNSDDALLSLNLQDMLDARTTACKKLSEVFGLIISVDCNVDIDGDTTTDNKGGDE